jgi:hypothetical protein
VGRVAGERRRDVVPADLQRVARHDPHEGTLGGHQGGERDHVVLDEHVGPVPRDDLAQLWLAVLRAIDQRLVRRLHECRQLLAGGLGELRCRLVDEVDPELTGRLLFRVRVGFGQVDEVLDEAEGLQPAGPRRLGGEHDPMPPVEEHLAEPDALVGGSIRGLGQEQHGQGIAHAAHASGGRARAIRPIRRLVL